MTLPFSLPAWVPPWLPFVVLIAAALYLLVFLIMPFSVFGVKSRLDSLEAELDEIHADIRRLALRLPEPLEAGPFDDTRRTLLPPNDELDPGPPPIPPAPETARATTSAGFNPPRSALHRGARRAHADAQPRRAEPKFDWPQPPL